MVEELFAAGLRLHGLHRVLPNPHPHPHPHPIPNPNQAAAEARVETERASMTRFTGEQLVRLTAQKESLELQLAEAKEAAVALQEMLAGLPLTLYPNPGPKP